MDVNTKPAFMLWKLDTKNLTDGITRACQYYRDKYGQEIERVEVRSGVQVPQIPTLRITHSAYVPANHLHVIPTAGDSPKNIQLSLGV